MKEQVKEVMKNNKLLEVALKKTEKQSDALSEFLKRNKLPNPVEEAEEDDNVFVPNRILNAQKQQQDSKSASEREPQINDFDDNIILEEKSK